MHCARRDVTLIIVLIPDKYQFYLDSLSHSTGDLDGYGRRTLPKRRAPGMDAERLQQQGIHMIDFFPLLQAFQRRQSSYLSFHHDDRHWNDAEIEEAAVITYRYLRDLMKADQP